MIMMTTPWETLENDREKKDSSAHRLCRPRRSRSLSLALSFSGTYDDTAWFLFLFIV